MSPYPNARPLHREPTRSGTETAGDGQCGAGWSHGCAWWKRITAKEEKGNRPSEVRAIFLVMLPSHMEGDYRERDVAKSGKDEEKLPPKGMGISQCSATWGIPEVWPFIFQSGEVQ